MKMLERKDWDLWSIIIGSLLLVGVAFVLPDSLFLTILSVPFVLFLPGYSAMALLFPDRRLDIIERIALSFGLSIAIAPLVGIGLRYAPSGFSLALMMLIIAMMTLVLALLSFYTRNRMVNAYLPIDPILAWCRIRSLSGKGGVTGKVFSLLLAVAIIASTSALAYLVMNPPPEESFTEFSMLGPGRNRTVYPENLIVGEATTVYLGIANHEHRQVEYKIEVWLCNMTVIDNQTNVNTMYLFDTMNISLPHEPYRLGGEWAGQWETTYNFQVEIPGQYRLFFLLYLDQEPAFPESPMVPYHDYSATESHRILDAMNNKVIDLNLVLSVTALPQ